MNPEDIGFVLLDEEVDLNIHGAYPLINIDDLYNDLTRNISKSKRSTDSILREYNIDSFYSLKFSYNLVRTTYKSFPKKIRDLIVERYSLIVNTYLNGNNV